MLNLSARPDLKQGSYPRSQSAVTWPGHVTGSHYALVFLPMEKEMATHSGALAWKNPMDGEAWWAAVHGVAKSWTRLSDFTSLHFLPMQQGYCNSTADAEILAFCTGAELNRRDRVLVEIEKNSSIALPGKGGHSRLLPSKLCVPSLKGFDEESYSNCS